MSSRKINKDKPITFCFVFFLDRCYKIIGTAGHTNHGPSKLSPRNRTPSKPDNSNDDTSDSGSKFDKEFELPLENEVLGNHNGDFTKLFGESISRFAVIFHIRKYIIAVSRKICDVIAVRSSFSIHIRQCSQQFKGI